MMTLVLFVHAGAVAIMAGLIWFVQIVHYPLLARVGAAQREAYAVEHQRRTTFIVAPVMLVEAATAIAIAIAAQGLVGGSAALGQKHTAGLVQIAAWLGVALLLIIWASTFFVQVPLHARLASAEEPGDAEEVQRIVHQLTRSNWVRTLAWSARLLLAMIFLRLA